MTPLPDDGPGLRAAVIETALAMNAAGINVNKSGNVSARCARGPLHGFVVTPTAVPYRTLEPGDLVFVSGAGDASASASKAKFSFAASIGVGGAGGSGGHADTVAVTNSGAVTTVGDAADGVFALAAIRSLTW